MHEYAVSKQIVKMANEEARHAGGHRITEIRLAIGDLSTFVDESIALYFDIFSAGTLAEGAQLVFRRIPAAFFCKTCQKNFLKPRTGFDCPDCGNQGSPTEIGKEFFIESLEVDDDGN